MSEISSKLNNLKPEGNETGLELCQLVYQELRLLARQKMQNERSGHTLQPTALVHEAWLRLVTAEQRTWQNRAHFFGAAAEAMRRILIDNARRKQAKKNGGGQQRLDIQDIEIAAETKDDELLAVHEALDKFAIEEKEKAELIKLRYFAGLNFEQAAEVLDISVPTAKRWWAYARAALFQEIKRQQGTLKDIHSDLR
jgi:RNA polymerase sigma factor (TIGR02999 family)